MKTEIIEGKQVITETLGQEPEPGTITAVESAYCGAGKQASLIALDFSRVTLVNSSLIGVIVNLYKSTQGTGTVVAIVNIKRFLKQVFEIADVTSILSFFDSYDDAVKSIGT